MFEWKGRLIDAAEVYYLKYDYGRANIWCKPRSDKCFNLDCSPEEFEQLKRLVKEGRKRG